MEDKKLFQMKMRHKSTGHCLETECDLITDCIVVAKPLALLLFYLNCVAVTPSVNFEVTCLLLPEFRISAKQKLYWNTESMIKVWK
jgi:hypothetical protein